jgi:hypothetical protein
MSNGRRVAPPHHAGAPLPSLRIEVLDIWDMDKDQILPRGPARALDIHVVGRQGILKTLASLRYSQRLSTFQNRDQSEPIIVTANVILSIHDHLLHRKSPLVIRVPLFRNEALCVISSFLPEVFTLFENTHSLFWNRDCGSADI